MSKIYSVNEISSLLQINPETVRRWIRAGKITAETTLGRCGTSIPEEALKEFLTGSPKYSKYLAAFPRTTDAYRLVGIAGISSVALALAILNPSKKDTKQDLLTPKEEQKLLESLYIEKNAKQDELNKNLETLQELQKTIDIQSAEISKISEVIRSLEIRISQDSKGEQ